MLYIHCTAKLTKVTRTILEAAPDPGSLHWIDSWYARLVKLDDVANVFLFTNAKSLYSIVVQRPPKNTVFFAVVAEFRKRLDLALMASGVDIEDIAATTESHVQYATCKSVSKSVLGSMNDMVPFIWDHVEHERKIDSGDLENMLNNMPHRPIGMEFPVKKLSELVDGL